MRSRFTFLLFYLLPFIYSVDIQCFTKGHLLQSKRWPFSVQEVTFYIAKGNLLSYVRPRPAAVALFSAEAIINRSMWRYIFGIY